MKIYKVKVNGKLYEVELESVTESSAILQTPKVVPPSIENAGTRILAPMQGTIIKTTVSIGALVKRGTVLAILEAMKLENEIQSPVEGKVQQILVTKGQAVDANQLLLIVG
jgi:glutaconyl-CoA/methylmalonyl-CoA decarboxylase subunit gamma